MLPLGNNLTAERNRIDYPIICEAYVSLSLRVFIFSQDPKITTRFSEYKDCIEMLHVSDQYQGLNALRAAEEAGQGTLLKKPDTERVVILKISGTTAALFHSSNSFCSLGTTKLLLDFIKYPLRVL